MADLKKLPLTSMDIPAEQLRKLKELFPEIFTEGNKIDWNKLKLTLGEQIDVGKERYGMNWPGKADCFKTIQQQSIATLVPCPEESVDFEKTENCFIEGDNLEALKLLQKSYLGKVKMIYIDPPYNTGKDFIYPDNYGESLETYLSYTEQVDENGRKFATNTDTDGRFHSKWLNMMYPRLKLARNLLKDDGVIFISIDDGEVKNLRALCDEIFGEENFIECITWNKRIPKNDKEIGNIHEYVLLYAKDSDLDHVFTMPKNGLEEISTLVNKLKRAKKELPKAEEKIKQLYDKKGYDRGITLYNSLSAEYELWGKINVSWPNAETIGPGYDVFHPITKKPVKVPDRGWRWKKETFDSLLDYDNVNELHDGTFICGQIWFDKDEDTQPSLVKFLKDVETLLLRSILSLKSGGGIEVESLFEGKNYYSYPKPTSLIKTFIQSIENEKALILDFFSGSSTTAQAVLDLNKEDGGNRKFIMVQLPELCDENSEAYKAGYKTIADIGKERIRRVIKKIKEEQNSAQGNLLEEDKSALDLGFKVFKLAKSNFNLWNADVEKTPEAITEQLEIHVDHISPESSQESILYEILLKSGFELTTPLEKLTIEGKIVFSIAEGELLICLEKQLTMAVIRGIAERSASRVVCLDAGFQNNDQLKTNAVQIMKSHGVLNFSTV